MEQSKLISIVIARFKIAYPYYFKNLSNEELIAMISMYSEELYMYDEKTLLSAIKSIIRNNKFMPTLNEIIEECEKQKKYKNNVVIERMIADGYFKDSKEIDKTYKLLESGVIPSWLLNDMKKYGYSEMIQEISTSNYLLGERI